jgi:hypothetical protein
MSAFEDWRDHRRAAVRGCAYWSVGREEGRCDLLNLSAGGVEITNPRPGLRVGEKLHVTLEIHSLRFEPQLVEVVRLSSEGLGLRFCSDDPDFTRRVGELIDELLAG